MPSDDLKVESSKIKNWIEKGKNGELQSSAEARLLAEKARVKYAAKDEAERLHREVFGNHASLESYSALEGKPFTIDETDKKSGLLEALSKPQRSPLLNHTFNAFPDSRLLAYANVFFEFEKQGMDVNVLPMGSTVTLKDGLVTVEYPNGRKASSLLFPSDKTEAAPTQVKIEAESSIDTILTQKDIDNNYSGLGRFKDENGTEFIGKFKNGTLVEGTMQLKDRVAAGTFDEETGKLIKGTWRSLDGKPMEPKLGKPEPIKAAEKEAEKVSDFEQDWTSIKSSFKAIEEKYPMLKIEDTSSKYIIGLDRPKGSKRVEISNNLTGETYVIEISPRKGAINYKDSSKLRFNTTRNTDYVSGVQDDENNFRFIENPESVVDGLNACAKYMADEKPENFSLKTHISMSTAQGNAEIMKMAPQQKLNYIQALLKDTKKKYDRISTDPIRGKNEKAYLASAQAEVNFLKRTYEDLWKNDRSKWTEREQQSTEVDELLLYFETKFSSN